MRKKILVSFFCLFFVVAVTNTMAASLSGDDTSAGLNQPVKIPIYATSSATDATGLAGAAFTLKFDTTVITNPTVTSTFFESFEVQLKEIDPNHAGPFEADGYLKPLVENEISGTGSDAGLSLAAASVQAKEIDSTTGTVILYLEGTTTADEAKLGEYQICIEPTVLDNANAGYDAGGEEIDLLIGADASIADPSDPNAFPVLLSSADNPDSNCFGFVLQEFPRGDASGDTNVNVIDAVKIISYINGNIPLSDLVGNNDFTGDTKVDILDVVKLIKFINGSIDSLD